MSDQDPIVELDFLNGEVGRVKSKLLALSKDIEDMEVEKALKHKKFLTESASKSSLLERLDGQIKSKELDIISLKSDIGSMELLLEDKRNELHISDSKIKSNTEEGLKLVALLEERRSSAKIAEEKAKREQVELNNKKEVLDIREKDLDNKEASITSALSQLAHDQEETRKLKGTLQDKIIQADELKRINEVKKVNFESLEKELSDKLIAQKILNGELEVIKEKNNILTSELTEKLEKFKKDESILATEKLSVASKLTDLILRERECKIKEKALSLREREKELDI